MWKFVQCKSREDMLLFFWNLWSKNRVFHKHWNDKKFREEKQINFTIQLQYKTTQDIRFKMLCLKQYIKFMHSDFLQSSFKVCGNYSHLHPSCIQCGVCLHKISRVNQIHFVSYMSHKPKLQCMYICMCKSAIKYFSF